MRSYLDRGYTVVKKKIGGASLDEDLRRIDSILSVLQDGQRLCVDANGRFDLDTAIAYAKALSQYDLFGYEEPGDPLDFELQAALRSYYKNPMATGDNLLSLQLVSASFRDRVFQYVYISVVAVSFKKKIKQSQIL